MGGFGRAELFPYSDIDVLVLLPNDQLPDQNEALKSQIEGFIGSCWDVGLDIGSSVRTVDECLHEAAQDVTVQTSLIESRLITGSAALCAGFQKQFFAALDPKAFFVAKTLELRQRHTNFEVRQLKHNEALLRLIRARLHLLTNRREDRLVFDLQTAVAQTFGFATESPDGARLRLRPSEALMRRYYWAAKAVTQLNQILLLNIEERLYPSTHEPRPLTAHFSEKAGMLEVNSDDLYQREPHAILETFQTTVGIKGLSARTLRALYNARAVMNGSFRNDPVNRATFKKIMTQHDGITHAMRLMNQTSVLGRYLWVFRRIVGQMQHDLFHVYTVDQHILMVLRNVRRFFIVEHAHEYPFCSQLASGMDKPWILYVAAIFHDIAKGRGGDHSELGAAEVRRFCAQHGFEQEDARLIEFIVRQHLTMSHVAQKSDLSDPDVIQAFAKRVGNERNLTALYLLTHQPESLERVERQTAGRPLPFDPAHPGGPRA